jgi:hypothetical protein
MRARLLLGFVFVLALGCSSSKLAPVSGTVTLNGQPLANAGVSFQPIAKSGMDAGVGASGKTDDKGEYTLTASTGQKGATLGENRVLISASTQDLENTDARPRRGPAIKDKVPKRYNEETELRFEVKSGNNKADFPLTSP